MYGYSVHHQEALTGYGTFTYSELVLELKMLRSNCDFRFVSPVNVEKRKGPVHAKKAYRVSRGIAPLIPNLRTKWK